jgi:large subunit ribosomal protein L18e
MKATNQFLKRSAVQLERRAKEEKVAIWSAAAEMLSRSAVNKVEVNLGHISRMVEGSSPVFVPGKVLGTGSVGKKLVIGAFSYSASARSKIVKAGGEALGVDEFLKRFPKGSGVRLVE